MTSVLSLAGMRLPAFARSPHFWRLTLIVAILSLGYYGIASSAPAIYESLPWVRLFIAFEFNYRLNGSLFFIPFLYAAIAFRWRGTLAVWLICMAIIMPHLVDYALDSASLLMNVALLSIPTLLVLIANMELQSREKERRAAAERELERQHYLAQVFEAQEAERKRISQELHDDTIQTLVVMANSIQSVVMDEESQFDVRTRMQLERIQYLALQTTEELRRLCLDLRPSILDNLGLMPAVRWLLDRFDEDGTLKGEMVVSGEERKLPSNLEVLVFRFIQEALNNARQHSGATQVVVTLEFETDGIEAIVQDNGRGFRVPDNLGSLATDGKLGLIGMLERARLMGGDFRIASSPGHGTTVSLSIGTRTGLAAPSGYRPAIAL